MSKWLGFSLTPSLRICDREEEHSHDDGSDGSLFVTDPLTHHPPGNIYIHIYVVVATINILNLISMCSLEI